MLVPYYSGGAEYDKIKEIAIKTNEQGEGFSVDFDALRAENPDTVAWIRFDEPSIISYPVVKSSDNKEYLTKTFSANDNKLGAIFMDMRCDSDFADRNTMIYGHNLKIGGEMFSQLKEYESEDFCKAHPEFYIYTPDGKVRMYKVFAASVVKDTSDAYNLTYNSLSGGCRGQCTVSDCQPVYLHQCKRGREISASGSSCRRVLIGRV